MAQLENFRLKVFRTVAQHLSFRKAAEHLFITQPTVTLQIKALEEELGVRLFAESYFGPAHRSDTARTGGRLPWFRDRKGARAFPLV